MNWTPAEESDLRILWERGFSAKSIGLALNKPRDIVIGKVHRLRLRRPKDPWVMKSTKLIGRTVEVTFHGRRSELRMRARISRPPGGTLLTVGAFLYSRRTFERVFQPAISDMRVEYFDALQSNRKWKARLIVLQGHIDCLTAAAAQLPISLIRLVGMIWRLGS